MRSAANIKGHPLHPALIPFPFAFLTAAAVSNLVGALTGQSAWWVTGGYLAVAGIATALLAAVPGLLDYFKTVPPNSSAKRRATKHMIVNLTAVGLFAVAWLARGAGGAAPTALTVVLELAALGLLVSGGWMGGTLVNRNQIGVDHRYAGAGKWREAHIELATDRSVRVAALDELAVNQMKLLHAGDRRIVLARTEDGYIAFDDRCPHRGGSLADGALQGGTVQCPWHGSQFDVMSGSVVCGPAAQGIRTYAVAELNGEVRLLPGPGVKPPVPRAQPRAGRSRPATQPRPPENPAGAR